MLLELAFGALRCVGQMVKKIAEAVFPLQIVSCETSRKMAAAADEAFLQASLRMADPQVGC